MKKSFFLFLFMTLFISTTVFAAPENYIYDDARILSIEEREALEVLASEQSAMHETAFILLTTYDTDGQYIREYIADFIDENGLGYDDFEGDTAVFGIDFTNRDVYIAGFGKAEFYLTDERISHLLNMTTPYLTEGNTAEAFKVFMREANIYLATEPNEVETYAPGYSDNYVPEGNYSTGSNEPSIFTTVWMQLLIAAVVAAISVAIMILTRGGRVTVNHATYVDSSHSGVKNAKDRYVRTTVTKVKRPSNNTKGGGGGGITGGGRTFSGGGGKF